MNEKQKECAAALRKAANLVQDHWTVGCMAREESGRPVSAWDPKATQFCMVGALIRAGKAHGINEIGQVLGIGGLAHHNDTSVENGLHAALLFDLAATLIENNEVPLR